MNKEYGTIDPNMGKTPRGRRTIDLGENWDGSHSTLPPYEEIDGVQIHPSRVARYLARLREKKVGPIRPDVG